MEYSKIIIIIVYIAIGISTVLFSLSYFHLTNEDAWITFKYARNLADGYGLVENPYGPTEEGYSTLTLVSLLAFFNHFFGFDIVYTSKIIGLLSVFGVMYFGYKIFYLLFNEFEFVITNEKTLMIKKSHFKMIFHLSSLGFLASIGLSNYFSYWATNGLETTLYSLNVLSICYFVLLSIMKQNYKNFYVVSILSFISLNTRPEGFLNFVFFIGIVLTWFIVNKPRDKKILKYLTISSLIFVGLSGSLFLFKLEYFGSIFSNPTYVKTALSIWSNKLAYLTGYFHDKGIFFTLLFLIMFSWVIKSTILNRTKAELKINFFLLVIFSFIISQIIFVYYIGGDYMNYYRFFITHYPLITLFIIGSSSFVLIKYRMKRKIIAVPVLAIIIVVSSAILFENVTTSNWYRMGMISPNDFFEKTNNPYYLAVLDLQKSMKDYPNDFFAAGEYGYIPYHVNYKGLDMMGLNTKAIARNFKTYDLNDALYANRDYVLSKHPKSFVVGFYYKPNNETSDNVYKFKINCEYKNGTLAEIQNQSDNCYNDAPQVYGKIAFHEGVDWYLKPYFESDFFLKNYEIPYTNYPKDFNIIKWNGKYQSSKEVRWNDVANYDKLLFGFYPVKENTMWVSSLSRILLKPDCNDRFFTLEGYVPDISKYENSEIEIQIRLDDKAVGDKILHTFDVNKSGKFVEKIPIDFGNFNCAEDNLITIKGTKITKNLTDSRDLSFVFIAAYFSN